MKRGDNMKRQDNDETMMGARIQRVRLQRHITQEVLAEKLNLSNAHQVSDIERGVSGLSLKKFSKLCEILDVDADYLLFGRLSSKTTLDNYLSRMTETQRQYAEDLLAVFAKSCGIE